MVEPLQDFLTVIQITDTHLYQDSCTELYGVSTHQSFMAVLDLIKKQNPSIDAIITTGDISQDESPASYQFFTDQLKAFRCPCFSLAGNHDSFQSMSNSFANYDDYQSCAFKGWRFILLNSQTEGIAGGLKKNSLKKLRQEIATACEPTLIFMHHQPVPVESEWLDKIALLNAEDFWQAIQVAPNLKGVIWGHVHQEFSAKKENLTLLATPSTCVQFKPKAKEFTLDHRQPGYRVLRLYPNGKIETWIKRLNPRQFLANENSPGY